MSNLSLMNCLVNENAAFFGIIDNDFDFKSVSDQEDNEEALNDGEA